MNRDRETELSCLKKDRIKEKALIVKDLEPWRSQGFLGSGEDQGSWIRIKYVGNG
jgi:hypothetical protein